MQLYHNDIGRRAESDGHTRSAQPAGSDDGHSARGVILAVKESAPVSRACLRSYNIEKGDLSSVCVARQSQIDLRRKDRRHFHNVGCMSEEYGKEAILEGFSERSHQRGMSAVGCAYHNYARTNSINSIFQILDSILFHRVAYHFRTSLIVVVAHHGIHSIARHAFAKGRKQHVNILAAFLIVSSQHDNVGVKFLECFHCSSQLTFSEEARQMKIGSKGYAVPVSRSRHIGGNDFIRRDAAHAGISQRCTSR